MPATEAELPIVRRFPALAALPRVALGRFPSPVERVTLAHGRVMLLKRDDRCADPIGGNKVRGLEWLLGDVGKGSHVVTVGPTGSTHALCTATYARTLGATTTVVRWNQEMNDAARVVGARLRGAASIVDARWVPAAYAVAGTLRLRRRVTWIPAGGAATVALLGHVNAALELAEQIARGECPEPPTVYVPLGTGGTAAGLSLGLRIAGLRSRVVAVRVVPRMLGRVGRVVSLANGVASLIERATGTRVPRITPADLRVEHARYGGAYGRPIPPGAGETVIAAAGIRLDDTYSRKACAAALESGDATPMLWLTFDGRLLQD